MNAGDTAYGLIEQLYPICRGLCCEGTKETLRIIKEIIPISIVGHPTGSKVFDWVIPDEWNVNDAYIKDPNGKKIVDFQASNLSVVHYSEPVDSVIPLEELKQHVCTDENNPGAIPYRTSWYKRRWGFCMTHDSYTGLSPGDYRVFIDSSFQSGTLDYGELLIKGKTSEEILLSTYICHPSLCNDNLSGVALLTSLAQFLLNRNNKYSYRVLFVPERIGVLTWAHKNTRMLSSIRECLVLTCVGGPGPITYKKTKSGSNVDELVKKVLDDIGDPYEIMEYDPANGSDEIVFSSPGLGISTSSIMRSPYGSFREYHTSADNLDFITPEALQDSYEKYLAVLDVLDNNDVYRNTTVGLPQLSKRGLYPTLGSQSSIQETSMEDWLRPLLWVLDFSDGSHSLVDIAIKSGLSFKEIKEAADTLKEEKLVVSCDQRTESNFRTN